MKTEGLDQVSNLLSKLGDQAMNVAAEALYDGANVMANAYANAPKTIRTEPFKGKRNKRLPSPEEVAALEGKTGIAKFKRDGGEVNTMVGIGASAGYVMLGKTKTAVRMIARSINSGTSFMQKQPVFRKAMSMNREAATAAIIATAEAKLNELTQG